MDNMNSNPAAPGSQDPIYEKRDPESLKDALWRMGVSLRYNTRSSMIEVAWHNGSWIEMGASGPVGTWFPEHPHVELHWEPLSDQAESRLFWNLAGRFRYSNGKKEDPFYFGRQLRGDCLDALMAEARRDPFTDYLESLPHWSSITGPAARSRVEWWLSELFLTPTGDSGDNLERWASRYPFLAAIERAYNPGAKIDQIPVLIGAQGLGKSAALRSMLPEIGGSLFSDGLHLADNPKVQVEATRGKVLVEISEMAGSTRAELERLKAYLSRQDDGAIRMAYARRAVPMPRMFAIVGTTNDQRPLPYDTSGNRRFVPIVLSRSTMAAEAYFGDIACASHMELTEVAGAQSWVQRSLTRRDLMWSEALFLWEFGMRAGLPRGLMEEQSAAARSHTYSDDAMEDLIQEHLFNIDHPLPIAALAKAAFIDRMDRSKMDRFRKALLSLGWTYDPKQRRIPGFRSPQRCFGPPGQDVARL